MRLTTSIMPATTTAMPTATPCDHVAASSIAADAFRRGRVKNRRAAVAAVAAVLIALSLAVLVVALFPTPASACAKDGVPSVSLDGHLAALNGRPAQRNLATWSLFVFTRAAVRDHAVTLAEDNREVARALPRDVFTHPWRWQFGDDTRPVYGTRVHHTYHRAGAYRIAVLAYYPIYATWQPFDYVTIHVR